MSISLLLALNGPNLTKGIQNYGRASSSFNIISNGRKETKRRWREILIDMAKFGTRLRERNEGSRNTSQKKLFVDTIDDLVEVLAAIILWLDSRIFLNHC